MGGPDIRFVIPGAPRGWARTGQRIVKTKEGRQFISNFTKAETRADEWTLKRAATEAMGDRPPLVGPVDLRITAWFAVPMSWSQKKQTEALAWGLLPITKPDFDNIGKLVDGIKGVVWRDDCLVTDFHFYKRYGTNPRVVIEVRAIDTALIRRDVLAE